MKQDPDEIIMTDAKKKAFCSKMRCTRNALEKAILQGPGGFDLVLEMESKADKAKSTEVGLQKRITQLVARVKELEAECDRLRAQLERRP